MSIRWKIALLCVVLALGPVIVLNNYTVKTFDGFTRRVHEDQMISYARVVGDEILRQRPDIESTGFVERLRQYEQRFGVRLQVIGPDGIVQMDSSDTPDVGKDVGGERDIARALGGRYGSRTYLLPDRSLFYYYIALPLMEQEELVAVVRAIAHTREITRAISRIYMDFQRMMWIVGGVAVFAAILLSLTLTRRLRQLTQAAHSFARGDSTLTLKPKGRDEIGQLERAFSRMAQELAERNAQQGNLLASTIHELKTPITGIKGAVQMLRDEGALDDPVSRDRFLGNIDISSDRLLRMVEQLAALSKLRAEELRGRKVKVKYGAFVKESVSRLFPLPPVRIEVVCPESDRDILLIPERMEQVLANLLDNAIRYTPPEGQITVTVQFVTGGVETVVRDTGSGIEAADLAQIFEHFFTTVPRNHLREFGMGLGLSIAQAIIQNHGGMLRAESEPGKGSTFRFTLPA